MTGPGDIPDGVKVGVMAALGFILVIALFLCSGPSS